MRADENQQEKFGDRWVHRWLMVAAAVGLGAAVQVRDGLYQPWGFLGLTFALAAGLMIYLLPRIPSIEAFGERAATWVFGAAIGIEFLLLFTRRAPGSGYAFDHGWLRAGTFYYSMLALAAVVSAGIVVWPRAGRGLVLVLVVIFCVIGAWVIRLVPQPYMDVWPAQTEGIKAFVRGHNPYKAAFPDIYNHAELYAPGVLREGKVQLGFPYPPMVFWMDLPGHLIGGDYRWSNLAAMALTAVLIAFMRPGRLGPMAAALALFMPRAFFVLESGWTEPATTLLLAATVFCAVRYPKAMPVMLGLFLCSKQYLLWAVAPVVLLAGWPPRWGKLARILGIALVTGCAVSLPLILWDVRAFMTANFGVADGTAFRMDALSYLALLGNIFGRVPSAGVATVVGFGAAAAATWLIALRGARTPAGYAAGVAVAHLCFFAFYKFAFCNYYSFLIGGFCCGVSALSVGTCALGLTPHPSPLPQGERGPESAIVDEPQVAYPAPGVERI